MLENFKNSQSELYEFLMHSVVKNNKVSHAYFLETNGFSLYKEFSIAVAKFFLCLSSSINSNNCGECSLCNLVEQGLCDDFKAIEPDGQWIKKEQMIELQRLFKTKSLTKNKRVYIIFDADKLNVSSANSILKFLEDPEDDIIAIIVAKNRYQVIDTILSRCQILRCSKDMENEDIYSDIFLSCVDQFVDLIETIGPKTLAYLGSFWTTSIKTRDDFSLFIKLIQDYYETLIDIKLNREYHSMIFESFFSKMIFLSQSITLNQLFRKLQVISKTSKKIQYNVNQSLQLDKLIIELSGGSYDKCNRC